MAGSLATMALRLRGASGHAAPAASEPGPPGPPTGAPVPGDAPVTRGIGRGRPAVAIRGTGHERVCDRERHREDGTSLVAISRCIGPAGGVERHGHETGAWCCGQRSRRTAAQRSEMFPALVSFQRSQMAARTGGERSEIVRGLHPCDRAGCGTVRKWQD